MATVHVVTIGIKRMGADGTALGAGSLISEHATSSSEMRIFPNAGVPNSANYPTIDAFLQLEADQDFEPKVVTNTLIVTYKP